MSHMIPPPPPLPSSLQPNDPHRVEANGPPVPEKSESPGFLACMSVLNSITQFLLGGAACTAFLYASIFRDVSSSVDQWPSSYAQHIILCVTGYVILMSQAMLVFNPYNGWATNLNCSQKKVLHIAMQICGSLLAIVGSFIKFLDSKPIFNSAHSILGFVAMLLTILGLFGGIFNFICSQHNEKVTVLKILHACLGCITITVAFTAKITAYALYANDPALGITFTVLALIGLLTSVFMKIFKRM